MSTGVPSPPHVPPDRSKIGQHASDSASAGRRGGERDLDSHPDDDARGRAGRWAPSPRITGVELVWVAVAGVALAVFTSWPLILHMPSRIAPDLGDPVRTAWEIAWVGHAMLHDPGHLFDANAFYPHPLSLAFSDSLLGYGPAAFFGHGTVAALVRYNLLFLWAWSLCFVGAYLLGRELGLGRLAGAAAGIAFAYAPYRVTEAGHLHVISSGGIPLALFLLLRGYRRSSRGLVLAGWLVSAWQVSLGFTLGLQFTYLLLVLAVLVLWHWWRGRLTPGVDARDDVDESAAQAQSHASADLATEAPGSSDRHAEQARGGVPTSSRRRSGVRGPLIPRRLLAVTLIGLAVLGAVTVYQARPYLKVAEEYPTAKRTLKEVKNYSSGPAALVSASSENRVWGGVTSGVRAHVHSKNEDVFFPGGLILVLAILGLCGTGGTEAGGIEAGGAGTGGTEAGGIPYTRRLRIGLLAGIVVCSVLAMGLGLTGAGYPYRLLYDYAPGWDGVRVPGRIFTLATLFYALLAGAGAQWLIARVRAWKAGTVSSRSVSASGRRAPASSHQPPSASTSGRPGFASSASSRRARTSSSSRRPEASYGLLTLPALLGILLLVGLLGEGAGHLGHPVVPQPARAEIGLPGPVLDLPTDGAYDRIWQYFSTDGFYEIPVGNSTFDMPAVDDLRGGMNGFPDKASVEKLRYYKIRTVVLHLQPLQLPGIVGYAYAEPPNVQAAAAKPIAGLGITRRRVGSIVIYEIGPGPAALHGTD